MRYIIFTADSRKAVRWQMRDISFADLMERCRTPRRTPETVEEYFSMTKEERGGVKDVGGFVAAYLRGGCRKTSNVEYRTMLTLDLDFIKGDLDEIRGIVTRALPEGCSYLIYSTHSHTPEAPRCRVVVPLAFPLFPTQAEAVSRRIGERIGTGYLDQTTHEAARLFYWPSVSKDGEYLFDARDGEPLDGDKVLESYEDWRDRSSWPVAEGEAIPDGREKKMLGDPRLKPGRVGLFCRAYTISAAIAMFLPTVYAPAGEGRYTYNGGSTAGGTITFDDLYLKAYQQHDPVCGRTVNAYDLVRIHLYGDGEESERQMETLVGGDAECRKESERDMAAALKGFDFSGLTLGKQRAPDTEEEGGTSAGKTPSRRPSPWEFLEVPADVEDGSWKEKLQLTKGAVKPSIFNYSLILNCDRFLFGKIWKNEFDGRFYTVGGLPWEKGRKLREWKEEDNSALSVYISQLYKIDNSQRMMTALSSLGASRRFHPVRDYFNSLAWDGKERLDRFIIEMLGADDTPLNRALSRLLVVSIVARVLEPGIKYDLCPILVGPEGCGKSTLLSVLGGEWFSDSISGIGNGKDAAEQLSGIILGELGEMAALKKAEREEVKRFITSTNDRYRPAYGRVTENHERHCTFAATSNKAQPLSGWDGNRRFPVIQCHPERVARGRWIGDRMSEIRDQLYAEALHIWSGQRPPLCLPPELEKASRLLEGEYNFDKNSPETDTVRSYLEVRLPEDWKQRTKDQRRLLIERALSGYEGIDMPLLTETRGQVCLEEIFTEALGVVSLREKRLLRESVATLMDSLPDWERLTTARFGPYGTQKGWRRRETN